jgi:acyl-CoA synthetase (AMP-forming)/AMP-acid ligase II
VRSWQGAIGYYEDPERTAATFTDDGWVRSGDLGSLDEAARCRSSDARRRSSSAAGSTSRRVRSKLVLAFDEIERCAVVDYPMNGWARSLRVCRDADGETIDFDTAVERLRRRSCHLQAPTGVACSMLCR